jgi:GNAT superfamily N-acetyltransferase
MAELGRPPLGGHAEAQRGVYRRYLADPAASIYVAELGGETVGAASLVVRARLNWSTPEAWIADLVVRPDARRRGVGSALLDACLQAARQADCHLLRLDCGTARTEAHALYEASGFARAGYDYQLRL